MAIGRAGEPVHTDDVYVFASSNDECVCHRRVTPGIFKHYGASTIAMANVSCRLCREDNEGYPGSVEHQGTFVLATPTTAMCE